MNPTPKTWIFRVHSAIYPPFQWNILSFEDCCQKSHAEMTAWLSLFPSFYFLFSFPLLSFLSSAIFHSPLSLSLSPSSPLPSPILSISSSDSLPLSADPQRQSALFCLSAIVYQHKNTNGRQLKAINSFEVDPLCAWHQPPWLLSPNTSRSIAATTSASPPQKSPASYLKPPVYKAPHRPQFGTWAPQKPEWLPQNDFFFFLWIELLGGGLTAMYWRK